MNPTYGLTRWLAGVLLCLLSGVSGAVNTVTVTYYHTDALGSVVATTDEVGNLLWRRTYQPYGEIQPPAAAADNEPLGYTGKPRDPTGLVYFGARYYDPQVGRFLGVDPAVIDPASGQTFNRYAYAHNNPYRYVDPDGRAAESGWDLFNVVLGLTSFASNVSAGNYGKAALDAAGVVADGFATVFPFVPGGAGSIIKASREGAEAVTDISAIVKEGAEAAAKGVGALKDGAKLPTGKALDAAIEHLGPGYKEIAPGVFKSADGTRMVRMTNSDLAKTGNHARAPHMNFETGRTVTKPNGKEQFISQENKHIFLPEEK